MADIKTKLNVGDTVWWVNCSNKVYKGTIKEIVCCDYQGALYCGIYSPSYRRNTNPVVHYSSVFKSREEAQKFAEYQISINAPRAGRDSKSIQNYFTHFYDKRQFLDNFTQNAAF